MLERLGEIDWDSLRHAYGQASDVPELFRALVSSDATKREQAIGELFSNIYHQGTVYPATAAAVPFLYEMLAFPETPDKRLVAHLLAGIAEGEGYLTRHTRRDDGKITWQRILTKQGKSLDAELAREREEIAAVRQEVGKGLSLLLPFLSFPDADLRQSIAAAAIHYPDYASQLLKALRAAEKVEEEEEVLLAIRESIEKLSTIEA